MSGRDYSDDDREDDDRNESDDEGSENEDDIFKEEAFTVLNPLDKRNQVIVSIEVGEIVNPSNPPKTSELKVDLKQYIKDQLKNANLKTADPTKAGKMIPLDLDTAKFWLVNGNTSFRRAQTPYPIKGRLTLPTRGVRSFHPSVGGEQNNGHFVIHQSEEGHCEIHDFHESKPSESIEEKIVKLADVYGNIEEPWLDSIKPRGHTHWQVPIYAPAMKLILMAVREGRLPKKHVKKTTTKSGHVMFEISDKLKTKVEESLHARIHEFKPFSLRDDLSLYLSRSDLPITSSTTGEIWKDKKKTVYENPGTGNTPPAMAFEKNCLVECTLNLVIGVTGKDFATKKK